MNNNKPIVSIVSITYNQGNYISEAIESWIRQKTDFEFEIIIGDDCSTDNTVSILETYQKKYPLLIHIVKQHKNQGHTRNLMNTLAFIKGDYIAFCAGDDYWIDNNKLQNQYDFFTKNKDCKIVYSNCLITDESDPKNNCNKLLNYSESFSFDIYDYLGQKYITAAPTAMIKRFDFAKINMSKFHRSVLDDEYLFSVLLKDGGRAYYVNEDTACYRMHINGLNSQQKVIVQLYNKLNTLHNLKSEFENDKIGRKILTSKIKEHIDRLFYYSFDGVFNINKKDLLKLFLVYRPESFLDVKFYYNWFVKKLSIIKILK